jgi:hypothetical protein
VCVGKGRGRDGDVGRRECAVGVGDVVGHSGVDFCMKGKPRITSSVVESGRVRTLSAVGLWREHGAVTQGIELHDPDTLLLERRQ